MANEQDIISIAMQAVSDHMQQTLMRARVRGQDVEQYRKKFHDAELTTVYFVAFNELLMKCEITSEELERRVRKFANTQYSASSAPMLVNNLLKASIDRNMGLPTFVKLIAAVFPEERRIGSSGLPVDKVVTQADIDSGKYPPTF
ncbi:hypothetical protein [Ralstonia phage RP31]|uniref:Uncharacterized protein n=2 Tax=Ripduovirus RP12 TaxID=2560700 RepID=A0A1L7N0Z8_9CAUD|nr:hypothetical protein FDH28_gp250 [Ralstonia phage RP12]BAW19145.1 hypothetical protein [Ralstonia phage RP12]BAW19431.1 hypothetical protein [Ralstonia phage RP31]